MSDDVKINIVTLEDELEYYEINKINLNNNTYLILSKVDSEEELQFVLKSFLDNFNTNS